MAHAAKYAASATGHMLSHYDRSKENLGDNIDLFRTHLNYNLAPDHGMSQLEFIQQRLSEVRHLNRADVNVMCDWVVTLPKEITCIAPDIHMTPNHEMVSRLFFERTYKFMAERYGEENVISAYVHKDEKTDHMHFAFIPVVEDQKRGGEKLSAKEAITRADLRTFHDDLEQYLDRFGDWRFHVQNEATREGNKSIAELKRGTAIENLQKQQIAAATQLQNLQRQMEQAEASADRRKKDLNAEISTLEQKRDGIMTSMQVADLEGRKTLTGALKGVKYTEFEALKRTAERVDELSLERDQAVARADSADERVNAAYADANEQLRSLRKQDKQELAADKEQARAEIRKEFTTQNTALELEVQRLQYENDRLTGKVKRLETAMDYLKYVIREQIPEIVRSVENRVREIISLSQGRER